MREAIRLGHAALAQNELETAKRHCQQRRATGGTPLQTHCREPLAGDAGHARGTPDAATGETAQAPEGVSRQNAASGGDIAWQPERCPAHQNRNKRPCAVHVGSRNSSNGTPILAGIGGMGATRTPVCIAA